MLRGPTTVPSTPAASLPGGIGVLGKLATNARRFLFRFLLLLLVLAVAAGLVHEFDTSALQARFFSDYAARVSFTVAPGASAHIAFPTSGPFDHSRGYTALPAFVERLQGKGFQIARQARVSPELEQLLAWGISPPYPENADVGLVIRNPDGSNLFDAAATRDSFARFEDVPSLIVAALVFMENRELLAPSDVRHSPVLEWDRLARAGALYAGSKLGLHVNHEGGSTLAIQLEKYRHSPHGYTQSAPEKLRQIVAASLKTYNNGTDTRPRRRQIVVDYLNTMPLAAAPGYGDVYGLAEGLHAWFGLTRETVDAALRATPPSPEKAFAFKHVLALIAAVRAPTRYLVNDRAALERRVDQYTRLMVQEGIIDAAFAESVRDVRLAFLSASEWRPAQSFVENKSLNAVRHELAGLLGIDNAYDLSRLHLRVDATIDPTLQHQITQLLQRMTDPQFVHAQGLNDEHLLRRGDPTRVRYSFVLYERTPSGNVERVHADNINAPFDINDGIKMELGSTAKLRTLAHYLELVAGLHRELGTLPPAQLSARATSASDPITKWVTTALSQSPNLALSELLDMALERSYSTSRNESFFTGGGLQSFANFKRSDNSGTRSVRVALQQSINLVFIRLMRDLVRFHQVRLAYDAGAVMKDTRDPTRRQLLAQIADDEGKAVLRRSFKRYEHLSADQIVTRLLGRHAGSRRRLAVLFFAWRIGSTPEDLGAWLTQHVGSVSENDVRHLYKAYGNPRLVLADYGYLLSLHPLDLWCAGEFFRNPTTSIADLLHRSAAARASTASWLFRSRNRRAQDIRLRTRIEADAFARMTPYWRALGFPFAHLVPSLATAIGSSADRPVALAELIGVIVNDGVRRPLRRIGRLDFATATPYETAFVPDLLADRRVMEPEVAAALRSTLAGVVETGTARRLRGAFVQHDGHPLVAGGKTGSGDNRFQTFRRGGGVISSRPINRTATYVYYIGERYFGAVTAHVPGGIAADYEFTSALPVSVLKLSAPILNARLP